MKWLTSFLQNRSHEVVVEGTNSSSCNVTSGVPQGSVLGQVLFLMYINDIGLSVHSEIRLFADDICDRPRENRPSSHLVLIVEIPVLKVLISITSLCSC